MSSFEEFLRRLKEDKNTSLHREFEEFLVEFKGRGMSSFLESSPEKQRKAVDEFLNTDFKTEVASKKSSEARQMAEVPQAPVRWAEREVQQESLEEEVLAAEASELERMVEEEGGPRVEYNKDDKKDNFRVEYKQDNTRVDYSSRNRDPWADTRPSDKEGDESIMVAYAARAAQEPDRVSEDNNYS